MRKKQNGCLGRGPVKNPPCFRMALFVSETLTQPDKEIQLDYEPNDKFVGVSTTRAHNVITECRVGREQEEIFYRGSAGVFLSSYKQW